MRRRRNPIPRGRLLVGAGLVGLAWWLFGDRVRYGAAMGPSAAAGTWIRTAPVTLANAAGVHPDVYTLGAVMRSEADGGPEAERIAVAWVARNAARASGKTVTAWATKASGASAGYYGGQNFESRVIATGKAPRKDDLALAQKILNGQVPDNTGGATNFIHPAGQDALARAGLKGYTKSAQQVIDRWGARGLQPRKVPGAPRLLVFVPGKKPPLVASIGSKVGAA